MKHEHCEVCRELMAANALTALDAADLRTLETHLQTCAGCRSEMNAWEETAALMALDAEPVEPSRQVRERILASVREETQPNTKANILAFQQPKGNLWTSLGSFGALAAAVAFLALAISLVALWQQNRTNQRELARLSTEVSQARAKLDHERAVVELLTSPDARMARLSGTSMAPAAHAMIAYDKSGHAMLMAKGLPMAPQGMAYQLWYIKDNQKMPGKVFTPDAGGNGTLEDQMPAVAFGGASFAVTLEPMNGVQVPTGSIYLLGAS
jgi:anti-sigma-K factor RskA